jgi:hypothetical protein
LRFVASPAVLTAAEALMDAVNTMFEASTGRNSNLREMATAINERKVGLAAAMTAYRDSVAT